ncbi:glutamate-tRNA ligase [Spizellomyces punctatus DAOM BR117]|uniref:Glutamate--tRNA ligase, mitochondrial n=2 Tax=Spizellomyces punctatus (strain DAOM BR117) TaxID=645134 RepID=A0A0L0HIQ5_SPIPD|nr:glutamate-tRNA ligase [Spizellomyces punctatus DAOM BR117]KND00704.1 glutamate-tRNA ligase [Spizellomyces punctatus DAOM BR117]|eukprot:XP_016608743.1 glutamate-tRNA ligase [Spizellomyces punctatus DAOM BR117]
MRSPLSTWCKMVLQRISGRSHIGLFSFAYSPASTLRLCIRIAAFSTKVNHAEQAPARVRFAPSPTGYLHLGGLRTALFNYLLARQTGGSLILRVEDTDQARTVDGAVNHLIKMLDWAGLTFDEGPTVGGKVGPYIQSERTALYQEKADRLLKEGHAYRCFCTSERLDKVRQMAKRTGRIIGYDQHCRHLDAAEVEQRVKHGLPHTVRFKVPEGKTVMEDIVHGRIEFSHRAVDDSIILKSDGLPTYHLANVVDDHMMGITHVLRGEEWVSSTPKHLLLYKAFNWQPPKFAHLPLLVNKDGSKLSKRQGDVHIEALLDKGYLPEALLNFVAFLGWGPGSTKEFYTLSELIRDFKLENINKSPAVVSYDKLNYLNKLHIARRLGDPEERDKLVAKLRPVLQEQFDSLMDEEAKRLLSDDVYFTTVLMAVKERIRLLTEVPKFSQPFFIAPNFEAAETRTWRSKLETKEIELVVGQMQQKVTKIGDSDWNTDTVKRALNEIAEEQGLDFVQVMKNLRYALTGTKVGVDMITIIHLLGKRRTLERLQTALNFIV